MNQRQATVTAVIRVLADRGVNYEFGGSVSAADIMTSTDKSRCVDIICAGFLAGEIEMSQEGQSKYFSKPSELRKYTVGLLNNWLRKAPELNSGNKYVAKNPGSRQGSSNETVRALKALLSITTDESARAEIEAEIANQLESLRPKVEINESVIPAHLKHLLKK